MALVFTESFAGFSSTADLADRGYTVTNSGFVSLDATGGPFGNQCLKLSSQNTGGLPRVHRNFAKAMSGTVGRIAFWVKTSVGFTPTGLTTTSGYLVALENATPNSWLDTAISDTGHLNLSRTESIRGSTKDFSALSRTKVNDGNWHHVQIELTIGTTTGAVKMWIDGELQYQATNIDTQDAASNFSTYTRLAVSANRLNNSVQDVYVSDIIVWDDTGTDFTGALPYPTHRVFPLFATSNASSSSFTPSTGSNYENIDEVSVDDDTTYNSSGTAGATDLFNMNDLPSGTSAIYGVAISTNARSEAGAPTISNLVRISGTNYASAATATTGTYAAYESILEDSPSSGDDWTLTELNAAEFGYTNVSGGNTIRATRLLVEAVIAPELDNEVRVSSFFIEQIMEEGSGALYTSGLISTTLVM